MPVALTVQITGSYVLHYHRIGLVIMALFDSADMILPVRLLRARRL